MLKLRFKIFEFNDKPDALGEVISQEGCVIEKNLSVCRNFDRSHIRSRLGIAQAEIEGKEVWANWVWPGGDKMPTFPLYPAMGGVAMEVEMQPDGTKLVKKARFDTLSIGTAKNADPNIKSIQEQCGLPVEGT